MCQCGNVVSIINPSHTLLMIIQCLLISSDDDDDDADDNIKPSNISSMCNGPSIMAYSMTATSNAVFKYYSARKPGIWLCG